MTFKFLVVLLIVFVERKRAADETFLINLLDQWATKNGTEFRKLLNPTTASFINLLFESKIADAQKKFASTGGALSSIDAYYLDSDVALDAVKTAM